MQIEKMMPERALVRIKPKDTTTPSGMMVVRNYQKNHIPSEAFEIGTIQALGEGDWDPVSVGDDVVIQAKLGGLAGVDVSIQFGEHRGTVAVVGLDEIVAKVE